MVAKRDTFMDERYWSQHTNFLEGGIMGYEKKSVETNISYEHHSILADATFADNVHLLIARYSKGDSISELRAGFPKIIASLESYNQVEGKKALNFKIMEQYVIALWLLSLALLLNIEQSQIERLLDLIGNEGSDALFERLASIKHPNRQTSTNLLYPKLYEPLYQALSANGRECDFLIAQFLKIYYKGMRHTYWYNRHRDTNSGFFGYWCFELAAYVKVFGIDDSSFADNIYYPRDLVKCN